MSLALSDGEKNKLSFDISYETPGEIAAEKCNMAQIALCLLLSILNGL